MLASLTYKDCVTNAKFYKVFFLQLYLNLELVPYVSTLGGCAGFTLGGDTRTSGRIMCGPGWDIWTLRLRSVALLPSSSSVMLGRS